MDRVTRAEAARRLSVNRSTITRWCRAHPALVDGAGLVSLEELRAHRAALIDPKLQTRGPGSGPDAPPPAPAAASAPRSDTLNDHRARRERALADDAELNLAERLGLTLRREAVEAALSEAGERMKQRAHRAVRDRSEALARIEDVREMEQALEEMMRTIFARGAADLVAAAVGSPADAA